MFEHNQFSNFRFLYLFVCTNFVSPKAGFAFLGRGEKTKTLGKGLVLFWGKHKKCSQFCSLISSFGFSVLFLFLQLMLVGHLGTKINKKKLRKTEQRKKYNKELNNFSVTITCSYTSKSDAARLQAAQLFFLH
jgi:hypothetical protein